MPRLFIAGVDVSGDVVGLDVQTITYVLNESDRTVAYGLSSTFQLYRTAYDLVIGLIPDVTKKVSVKLEVNDDITIETDLYGIGVRDCGCYAEVTITVEPEYREEYANLSKTIITDDDHGTQLDDKGAVLKLPFCFEVDFLGYIVLFLYLLVSPLFLFVDIIIKVFDGDFDGIDQVRYFVRGCHRYAVGYNVNKTIQHHVQNAGIAYVSSILQDQYPRMAMLDGFGTNGLTRTDAPSNKNYDPMYFFNYTAPQVLTLLAKMFNSDWRIINGTLYFEKKEWFADHAYKLEGDLLDDICITQDPVQNMNGLRIQYDDDTSETQWNKVKPRYRIIEDFNTSSHAGLKGFREEVIKGLSLNRHVDDGAGDGFLKRRRNEYGIHDDLILSQGQTFSIRLLNVKDGQANKFRYADKKYISTENYNLYSFDLSMDYFGGTAIYDEFWSIEDPRTSLRYFAPEIKIKPTNLCTTLDQINNRSMNVYWQTAYGRAIPSEIEYDIQEGTLTLRNCTIWP